MPRTIRFTLAALLSLGLAHIAHSAQAAPSMPDLATVNKSCYAEVGPALQTADGKLTQEVRNAYLSWAEKTVLQELRDHNQSVPESSVADVRRNETLRDGIFGSVYPPDPSILQNYVELRSELGDAYVPKYRSLILAIAVAKRVKGVEDRAALQQIGRDYQPGFWVDETLQVPGSEGEKEFIRKIAEFMKQSSVTALTLYDNASWRDRLKEALAKQGVAANFLNEIQRSLQFGERLKNALIVLGQRPASRDAKPGTTAWIKHLVAINEAKPASVPNGMTWPLFPLDTAPWPLLMPLAHPVPLSEADYIWEAYQGLHGDDRFHTYGPYRGDEDLMPNCLNPSRWFWDAWPDRIVHGGMCVPISKGTVDLYTSLGRPAMWAGQPGHANLISYQNVGGAWTAEIEQDFAGGPFVTYAQWYFDDDPGTLIRSRDLYWWPGAEYQLGQALAMNSSLKSYMDTRLAANIFRAMPAENRTTLGVKLLQNALMINSYNPEIWYRLAEQTPDPMACLSIAQAAIARRPGLVTDHSGNPPAAVEGGGHAADQYWSTLANYTVPIALMTHAAPAKIEEMRRIHEFLKTAPGISDYDRAAYAEKYVALPPDPKADNVEYDLKLVANKDNYGILRMGQRYRDGDGVTPSDAKAQQFFASAAREGDSAAAILLENLTPSIPGDQIKVTVSSVWEKDCAAAHLIDGAGMLGAVHDNDGIARSMWFSKERPAPQPPAPGLAPSPAWARFDFAQPMRFEAIRIWNENQANLTDRGFRKTRIYGTTDGTTWIPLTSQPIIELPRASGAPRLLPTTIPNEASRRALKAVIIAAEAADGDYGSAYYGLSAVRFVAPRLTNVLPSRSITVTASSQYGADQGVTHLIDGSGMLGSLHDNHYASNTMWHTVENPTATAPAQGLPASPAWVRFDFAQPQDIEALLIWNHNQQKLTDRGLHKIHVYCSMDGTTWKPLTSDATVELPPADASSLIGPSAVLNDFTTNTFKSVIIAADPKDGNYGSNVYGLSAVRFVLKH